MRVYWQVPKHSESCHASEGLQKLCSLPVIALLFLALFPPSRASSLGSACSLGADSGLLVPHPHFVYSTLLRFIICLCGYYPLDRSSWWKCLSPPVSPSPPQPEHYGREGIRMGGGTHRQQEGKGCFLASYFCPSLLLSLSLGSLYHNIKVRGQGRAGKKGADG